MNRKQIVSDPRWTRATPEQRQKLLSMASDPSGSLMDQAKVGLGMLGEASDRLPQNIVRSKTLDPLGEKVAEVGGRFGHPTLGAVLGTGVQMLPDTASAMMGLEGMNNSTNPIVRGLMKTTRELGPEYDAQNAAISVLKRTPPEGGMAPRYSPPERIAPTAQPRPIVPAEPVPSNIPTRYPSKPGDFMAYAEGRLNSGKPLNPQELMDWQSKLKTDLSNPSVIPRFQVDANGKSTGKVTEIFQQASDLLSRTRSAFNKIAGPLIKNANLPENAIPTREGLNKAYGVASNQEALVRGLKKAGKYALLTALGLGGGGVLLNKLGGNK